MPRAPILATLLTLAACQPAPGPDVPGPADHCGAADYAHLIGQHRDAAATIRPDGPIRLIGPDTAVTMDYSASRLNVIHDADGIITAIECG